MQLERGEQVPGDPRAPERGMGERIHAAKDSVGGPCRAAEVPTDKQGDAETDGDECPRRQQTEEDPRRSASQGERASTEGESPGRNAAVPRGADRP